MTKDEKLLRNDQWNPFLWLGILNLGSAIVLARLNIYLGKQVNYLEYLSLFNAMTIFMLVFVGISITLSLTGLWKARFKNVPLMLTSLASSAFLVLMLFVD